MSFDEILSDAETRIRDTRTAGATLRFVARDGAPLGHLAGRVKLVNHEFRLGANAFLLNSIANKGLRRVYEKAFSALMNYATLPFYWGGYEKNKDEPGSRRVETMAAWCKRHGIAAKGHPLLWHEVFPEWAKGLSDDDVVGRLQARVGETVSQFRGIIDIWDVVNEATVSHRFDNAVGRWIAGQGAAACVENALRWAHTAAPGAMLLYNDFNLSPEFEQLLSALLERGAPLAAVGIQSHMHKEHWPIERVWQVCETYKRFGLPVHFTEVSVLSGRFKAGDDNDWHATRTDWPTTQEGEALQLEYGRRLYTVLFSHPAVEAITWWDLSDQGAWQGAPAGLVRKDMTPKPLYEWLMAAFGPGGLWSTNERVLADSAGVVTPRCFFGLYEVAGKAQSGEKLRGKFAFNRAGPREVVVQLS